MSTGPQERASSLSAVQVLAVAALPVACLPGPGRASAPGTLTSQRPAGVLPTFLDGVRTPRPVFLTASMRPPGAERRARGLGRLVHFTVSGFCLVIVGAMIAGLAT
jgi:hypothetical protein